MTWVWVKTPSPNPPWWFILFIFGGQPGSPTFHPRPRSIASLLLLFCFPQVCLSLYAGSIPQASLIVPRWSPGL